MFTNWFDDEVLSSYDLLIGDLIEDLFYDQFDEDVPMADDHHSDGADSKQKGVEQNVNKETEKVRISPLWGDKKYLILKISAQKILNIQRVLRCPKYGLRPKLVLGCKSFVLVPKSRILY